MGDGRQQVVLTISTNQNNYDVYANRGASYIAGITDLTVVINSGKVVGSTSTGTYALTVSSSFHADDTVHIINNGTIAGRGALGGAGGNIVQSDGSPPPSPQNGVAGNPGGPAVRIQRATFITNNGVIGGGGGGGGGGASCGRATAPFDAVGGSGGGAGQGGGTDAGGVAGIATDEGYGGAVANGNAGSAGSSSAPGTGGNSVTAGTITGGAAGSGGSLGSAGSSGGAGTGGATGSGGAGGAAGACLSGDSFVTWLATGTRYGSIS